MSRAYLNGMLLLQQNRHDLDERESRQALAQEPNHEIAYAYLALTLIFQDHNDEALREANEAIRCATSVTLSQFVLGRAL